MFLNFLFLIFFFPICNSIDSITQKQPLTNSNLLLSENGKFALGFFNPGNSNHTYLGIWYHKIPVQTVVWVANRNSPITGSSGILSISPEGNLVLYNQSQDLKISIWSTNISTETTNYSCVAQLLDSGNLVLVRNGSQITIWQSFDYPTDTLLPSMKLGLDLRTGLNRFITSWKSENDPGIGEYTFKLYLVGSPQFFLYKGLTPYWRNSPWPWSKFLNTEVPDYLDRYTFANNDEEIYYAFFVDDVSVLTRTVVDRFGFLRRLTWDYNDNQWKQTWYAPIYNYNHCGPYGFCDSSLNFECTCLPGYTPKSVKDWYLRDGSSGCIRKREESVSMCRNGEGFVKVAGVKVPDSSISALMKTSTSSSECEQLCLRNCSCKAYANLDIQRKGDGCLTWYGELIDATASEKGKDLYVRVDAIELAESSKKPNPFIKKKKILAVLVLTASASSFLIILFAYRWQKRKRKTIGKLKKDGKKRLFRTMVAKGLVESSQLPDLPFFDLETISAATNNFSPANKLGQGGFGLVFKGKLLDRQEIAVKRLSRSSGQGMEEFVNEIMLIARLQHRNLVKLLGCCIHGDEQMLIYEYLTNNSLDSFIFDQRKKLLLDWRKRFTILSGIARGIMYLHHDSRLRIVHRDLKTSNILLDSQMNPKISDFGMARIFQGDQVQEKTNRVVGTYGYMAPEYVVFGKYSTKSDIFSFGVILLEIISGKKSSSPYQEDPSLNLIAHVWDLWRENRSIELVDSFLLTATCVSSEVLRCIQIGLLCVEEDIMDRPNMSEAVLMLNGEATLPCPKKPAFLLRNSNEANLSMPRCNCCSVDKETITDVKPR